jgi:hypothetical protein
MSFLDPLLGVIAYGAEVSTTLAQPGRRRGTELTTIDFDTELGCVNTKPV